MTAGTVAVIAVLSAGVVLFASLVGAPSLLLLGTRAVSDGRLMVFMCMWPACHLCLSAANDSFQHTCKSLVWKYPVVWYFCHDVDALLCHGVRAAALGGPLSI